MTRTKISLTGSQYSRVDTSARVVVDGVRGCKKTRSEDVQGKESAVK